MPPSVAPLDAAIQAVQSMTCRSAESVGLLTVVTTVRQLRVALAAGDWDGVDLAVTELADSGLPIPAVCAAEVDAAKSTAATRQALSSLKAAMEVGRATGPATALNVSAVSAAGLLLAVQRASRVSNKSPELVRAISAARAVAEVRQALVMEQWDALGPALTAALAVVPPGDPEAEMLRVQWFVDSHKVEAKLLAAMRLVGDARTAAGDSSERPAPTDADSVAALVSAVSAAASLEQPSPQVSTLLDFGRAVLALRKALGKRNASAIDAAVQDAEDVMERHRRRLGLQWFGDSADKPAGASAGVTGAGAGGVAHSALSTSEAAVVRQADRFARREVKAARGVLLRTQCLAMLHDAMRTGAVVGVTAPLVFHGTITVFSGDVDVSDTDAAPLDAAIHAVVERGGMDVPDVAQLLTLARVLRQVRLATVAEDWSRVRELVADAHGQCTDMPPRVAEELRATMCAATASQLTAQLTDALDNGQVAGRAGDLDTTSVHVAALDAAVRAAEHLSPVEVWAWTGAVPAEDGPEPEAGAGAGTAGSDATASRAPPAPTVRFPPQLSKLIRTATVVKRLREALLVQNWVDVRSIVASVQHQPAGLAAAAAHEIDLVAAELNHRAIIEGPLQAALVRGGPQGDVGAADAPTTVQLSELDAAIGHAASIGAETDAAVQLVQTAVALRRLRAAFQAQNWPLLADLVSQVQYVDLLDAARPEVARYKAEVSQRCVVRDLEAALSTGGGLHDGVIDVRLVTTDQLQAAVDQAEKFGTHSDEAALLLYTARFMLTLRRALVSNDLPGMVTALQHAGDQQLAALVQPELTALLQEFDDRAICAELTAALHQNRIGGGGAGADGRADGGADGGAGHDDGGAGGAATAAGVGTDPSVKDLDVAIAYSEQLGARSHRSRQLLATAKLVRQLRVSLSAGNVSDAAAVLGAAPQVTIAPEGADEVAAARAMVATVDAQTAVLAALTSGPVVRAHRGGNGGLPGAATAGHGDSNGDGGDGDGGPRAAPPQVTLAAGPPTAHLHALDAALAGLGGSHSGGGNNLRAFAHGVRHMRAAVLEGRWEDVPMQLAAVEESRVALDPDVAAALAAEVAGVRAVYEYRRVFAGAAASLVDAMHDAGDPAALEAAIQVAVRAGTPAACAADLELPRLVAEAQAILTEQLECKLQLAAAMKVMQPPALTAAIGRAERAGYKQPDLEEAGDYLARLQALVALAARALDTYDDGDMRGALAEADRLGVTLEADGQLRRLLALPARSRLQLQLKRALRKGNAVAVAKTTMEIKRLFFSENQGLHALADYPGLRPLADFNAAHGAAASSMAPPWLSFGRQPLHVPLMQLDAALVPSALDLNKSVLGYCGDRPFSNPDALAELALATALAAPALRDELYAQLARHVTLNPREVSRERGWQLMYLALNCFAPSEGFENYVEAFVRDAQRVQCVMALHVTVFMGPRATPPTSAELRELLEGHQHRPVGDGAGEAAEKKDHDDEVVGGGVGVSAGPGASAGAGVGAGVGAGAAGHRLKGRQPQPRGAGVDGSLGGPSALAAPRLADARRAHSQGHTP